MVTDTRRHLNEKKNKQLVDMIKEWHRQNKLIQTLKKEIFKSRDAKDWPLCVQKMIEMKQFVDDELRPQHEDMEEDDEKYKTIQSLIKQGEERLD